GTLALVTAFSYPNTCGKVIMQSPYIDETVLNIIKETNLNQTIDIFHTIGDKENEAKLVDGRVVDLLTPNRELKDILEEKDVNHYNDELDKGDHTWKYFQKDLPRALEKMFLENNLL